MATKKTATKKTAAKKTAAKKTAVKKTAVKKTAVKKTAAKKAPAKKATANKTAAKKTRASAGVADQAAKFAPLASALATQSGVETAKMFGALALRVKGKGFVMVDKHGRFVAKLPEERIGALVSSGAGALYDPGHGRPMKGWVAVPEGALDWVALAREAHRYVESMA